MGAGEGDEQDLAALHILAVASVQTFAAWAISYTAVGFATLADDALHGTSISFPVAARRLWRAALRGYVGWNCLSRGYSKQPATV